jgi:ABC-type dipeptide/oligopeptide/nickel transport system permease subunit
VIGHTALARAVARFARRNPLGALGGLWAGIFPGLAIFTAVLGFNLLGDALHDVLEPRLRGARATERLLSR